MSGSKQLHNSGVVSFCDWTDGTRSMGDKQWKMIAAGPSYVPTTRKPATQKMIRTDSKAGSGRMFSKDKSGLTKGERNIISGICNNRGDLGKNGLIVDKLVYGGHIVTHKDAWMVGKPLQRRTLPPVDADINPQVIALNLKEAYCTSCDSRRGSSSNSSQGWEESPRFPTASYGFRGGKIRRASAGPQRVIPQIDRAKKKMDVYMPRLPSGDEEQDIIPKGDATNTYSVTNNEGRTEIRVDFADSGSTTGDVHMHAPPGTPTSEVGVSYQAL